MTSTAPRVSILGCGWVGHALGRHLVDAGWTVRGSTTTPDKVDALRRDGIEPFLLRLDPDVSGDDLAPFFDADALVLNVPPPRGVDDRRSYHRRQIEAVRERAAGRVPWIVFVSSTGVYPDVEREVTEADVPPGALDALGGDRRRATGDVLLDVEGRLWTDDAVDTTIVRFGGLYGADRHPARFLAGRTGVSRPQAPVNLIHQDDCVGLLHTVLDQNATGRVVNGVSDAHPTRKALYTRAAEVQGLTPPTFDDADTRSGKQVSNRVARDELGYAFQHPDPMADLLPAASEEL
jgi:nucleoside-diphosphate-sugar epimerase